MWLAHLRYSVNVPLCTKYININKKNKVVAIISNYLKCLIKNENENEKN